MTISRVSIVGVALMAAVFSGCDGDAEQPPSGEPSAATVPSPAPAASEPTASTPVASPVPSQSTISTQPTETAATSVPSQSTVSTRPTETAPPVASPQSTASVAPAEETPTQAPAAVTGSSTGGSGLTPWEEGLTIRTLLGYDAIPAILEPKFVDVVQADEWLDPDGLVLGLSINGDNRAYSIPMLSSHEIVNDTVGGKPVAVTW